MYYVMTFGKLRSLPTYKPVQVCPSPVNPGLQTHWKPSGRSTHLAFKLQGVVPVAHSLISVNNRRPKIWNSDVHMHFQVLSLWWLIADLPAVMGKFVEVVSGKPRNCDVTVI